MVRSFLVVVTASLAAALAAGGAYAAPSAIAQVSSRRTVVGQPIRFNITVQGGTPDASISPPCKRGSS